MRTKINSVGRVRRIYKNLRENSDLLLKIKIVNDGRIPRGLLIEGRPAIRDALKEFEIASILDIENEKRPPIPISKPSSFMKKWWNKSIIELNILCE